MQEKDIKKGKEAEDKLYDLFKIVFDSELIKDENKYAIFDFYSNKTLVELKSRNNNFNDYKTTMVGMNKVNYGIKSKKNVYFVFEFLDGLYYWKLDYKELSEFEIKTGGTIARGRNEFSSYLYIPIYKLKKITNNNTPPNTENIIYKCLLETETDYNNNSNSNNCILVL